MHILIIPSELYQPLRTPLAGIFQSHHATLLQEEGNMVGVISAGFIPFNYSFKSFPYKEHEKIGSIHVYRNYIRTFLPGRIMVKFFWKYLVWLYLKLFIKYIEENGCPDVIHAHNSLFAGMAAVEIKKKYNLPFVITEHSSLFERNLIPENHLYLSNLVFRNACRITVVSTSLGKSLQRMFPESISSFIPIFNLPERDFFLATDKLESNSSGCFTFLSIGSLDDNKNHQSLIEAFGMQFKGNASIKLRIGGDGPLKSSLLRKVKNLGLDNQVLLCGHLTREEVKSELAKCDVFVLPSIVETFGVVLIEALAMGKPIIATKSGGPEDIVNEKNGYLVQVKDTNALAAAMLSMVHHIKEFDSEIIKRDCKEKFGRDKFAFRLLDIYKEINEK